MGNGDWGLGIGPNPQSPFKKLYIISELNPNLYLE
jgi:hypothetical protein